MHACCFWRKGKQCSILPEFLSPLFPRLLILSSEFPEKTETTRGPSFFPYLFYQWEKFELSSAKNLQDGQEAQICVCTPSWSSVQVYPNAFWAMIYPPFWIISLYFWLGLLQNEGWLISQPKNQRAETSAWSFDLAFLSKMKLCWQQGKLHGLPTCVITPDSMLRRNPVLDFTLCCHFSKFLIIFSLN